ncbi:MAG: serine/threonine protein kinase [Xanthomonadales bacterium]|nr:serine/threonine protein kinase [Xanthomonadales bacterium]
MDLSTAVPYAQGATGRVLKATDESTGKPVAIKVWRRDDPLWRARWQREADALRRLHHPNICPLLDAREYEGLPALVFPFVEGQPIDLALRAAPWPAVIECVISVVDAIAHAHAAGVIHRDLKPANILTTMVDERIHPVVVDFGLANANDEQQLTIEGQILGTPGYLAPEQAQGRPADGRSDLYSLGVIMFQLLAGRLPHQATRSTELLLRTIRDDAPLLHQLRPEMPEALSRVVQHCLEREAARRYQRAEDLLADLRAVLARDRVSAPRVGPVYRLRRRLRRAPWLWAALATSVLALSWVGWAGWRSSVAQRQIAEQSRQLERQVSTIERDLQLLFAAPAHDIRAEVAQISDRAIGEAQALAQLNTGPIAAAAQAAIGRLHVALGRPLQAIEPLERAWFAGMQDPQLAQLLGQAHAAAYLEAVEMARRQADDDAYEEALRAAEQAHGEPAKRFLAAGEPDEPIARALLARLQGNNQQAIDLLDAQAETIWPLPTLLLNLGLRLDEISTHLREGQAGAAAQLHSDSADLVARVTELARSHPEVWRLSCRYDGLAAGIRQAGVALSSVDLVHCETLATIDPERHAHRLVAGRAYVREANWLYLTGADPRPAIAKGLGWVGDQPADDAELAGLSGALLYAQAIHQQQVQGELVPELLQRAASGLELALQQQPNDPELLSELARTLQQLASARYGLGDDGDPVFAAAIARLRQPAAQRYLSLRLALVDLLVWQGYERSIRGLPAAEILDQALAEVAQALDRWPDAPALHAAQGMSARTLAEHQLATGTDPVAAADLADAAFARALTLQPERYSALFNQIGAPIVRARWALSQGRTIAAELDLIDRQLQRLRALSGSEDELAVQVGYRQMLAARAAIADGDRAGALVSAARERLAVALRSEWDRIPALIALGELALAEHAADQAKGAIDRVRWREDLEALRAGLRSSPQLVELRRLLEQLERLGEGGSVDIG